jgi:hypothetical protein
MKQYIGVSLLLSIIILSSYKWHGTGRLYDKRNQYFVTCRLTQEKRVEPFFGEDSIKCFYTCTDLETMVITSHSDYICNKQIIAPRGEKRDWRGK